MSRVWGTRPWPQALWRGVLLLTLVVLTCVLVSIGVYRQALGGALQHDRQRATQRLTFYAQTLESSLARFEALPGLLALERALSALVQDPQNPARRHAANVYLETAQQASGVAAAYLMDEKGRTLAASNWRQSTSFVGHHYGFRPYFRQALSGATGRLYAIGATTGEPGYFLAAPLKLEGRVAGVIAIKVALDSFESALKGSGDPVLLADALGVVFIASQDAWRYRSLAPLSSQAATQLEQTRQYAPHRPHPLFAGAGLGRVDTSVTLADGASPSWLWQSRRVGPLHWQLVLLQDPAVLHRDALVEATASALGLALLAALAALAALRQRRRRDLQRLHASLEQRIAERTTDLSRQVAALERAEGILRQTQDKAVQAGKLAVLGQMAAGLTHELNQPLAALHAYADNANALLARGDVQAVHGNLEAISHLAGRLGRLVGHLKAFSRQMPPARSPVALDAALSNALLIVEPRRRELGAELDVQSVQPGLMLMAETVRLEQVLVNLLRNALDAAAQVRPAQVQVRAQAHDDSICIEVLDNGSGFDGAVSERLFEPFFTTKDLGAGLGLGLAISHAIVEGFGGRIEAANRASGGAAFRVWLPAAGPLAATEFA